MQEQNMVNTETADTGVADSGTEQTQVEAKTFTQDEVNDIVAKRVGQLKNKYSYDPTEVEELRKFRESVEEEQLIKRQDFDKVLAKHKEKAENEITSLRGELERIKVDGSLIDSASKHKAVAPQQVAKLLKEQVRLQSDGSVVVVDSEGNPRYDDNADLYTVDKLVDEFLTENQFFRSAGPAGTGSTSNTNTASSPEADLASLDMTNPEHRNLYRKLKAQGKL